MQPMRKNSVIKIHTRFHRYRQEYESPRLFVIVVRKRKQDLEDSTLKEAHTEKPYRTLKKVQYFGSSSFLTVGLDRTFCGGCTLREIYRGQPNDQAR
ncbi:hypothetical protein BGX33_009298 [Mortierella sp. NVP41]|nr:hypothetical protein BGX33_009298 [Mortierella sp. NVP41]